jgi:hypothetical protein
MAIAAIDFLLDLSEEASSGSLESSANVGRRCTYQFGITTL